MGQLGVSETFVNKTEGHSYGTHCYPLEGTILDGTLPNLYRYGLEEFGRCTGKVYVDRDGESLHVGYVFEKLCYYESTPGWRSEPPEQYLREAWVSIGTYHPAREEHLTFP